MCVMCTYHKINNLLCTFLKWHVHKHIAISNTGYDVALHDKYANTYNHDNQLDL